MRIRIYDSQHMTLRYPTNELVDLVSSIVNKLESTNT